MKNLKLVARETKKGTVVDVSGIKVGRDFVVIAGPCCVAGLSNREHHPIPFRGWGSTG